VTGSATPFALSRLHPGSLALQPAGLLNSLKEPLSVGGGEKAPIMDAPNMAQQFLSLDKS